MKFSTNVWSPVRFPSAYLPRRAFSIFKEATTFTSSYWPHPVGTSSLITVKRSVFLAHASMLPVRDALPSYIEYLRAHDEHASRLKRATHCMTAWRTPDGQGGEHDDGEHGAGARLAHLVDAIPEHARKEGVALVVWRWYGGTALGGERWKCISSVAKEALREGGFLGTTPSKDAPTETTRSGKRRR
jgi:hypothetical protein